MAIEFRCVNCNKLLRVKEESAGKKAKCPECATVLQIPMPGAPPADDEYEIEQPAVPPTPNFAAPRPGASARPAASANPFQSPTAHDTGMTPGSAIGSGAIVPTRIDFGTVLNRSWLVFKENIGVLIGGMIIVSVVGAAASGLILGATFIMGLALGELGIILFPVAFLAAIAVSFYLQIGLHILILKAARQQRPEIGDLFKGGPFFLAVLGAGLIFGVAQAIGTLLFIIPGIIIGLMFSQFLYLIIDKNLGVMDSLKTSKEITTGNKMTLFLLLLAIGALPVVLIIVIALVSQISAILALLLLPVAVVVNILIGPFLQMVIATAYLTMTGQLRNAT